MTDPDPEERRNGALTKPATGAPALATQPLSEDYPSAWDRWGKALVMVWRTAFAQSDPAWTQLDPWQEDLLRRVLEIYPPGHERAGQLRYRQVVISVSRQVGKSDLAAMLSLYGLIRAQNQLVIGIASSADQARIVYDRANKAIAGSPALAKRFKRLTDTRGLRTLDGGRYEIKAAKSAALQGLPVAVGVVDELHILPPELWTDLVNGTGGRANALVVGITTAGSVDSTLLKDLYVIGKKAAAGDPAFERFGFFLWEADSSEIPDDDGELLELLKQANPSLAQGRLDAGAILSDVRGMPAAEVVRYRLNRFTDSTTSFIDLSAWAKCQRDSEAVFPATDDARMVFCFDRTPDWGYASCAVAVMDAKGVMHTELVASLVKPSLEQLLELATMLYQFNPGAFAVDGYGLRELGVELKKQGYPTHILSGSEVLSASAGFYAKTIQGRISHAGDPLLSVQIPGTKRKAVGAHFRINPGESSVYGIDAVMATVGAVYVSELLAQGTSQGVL